MAGLPRGTVTVLMSDVEGSTRMWERSSSEMSSAMSELDVLVDELVAKFEGARPAEQGEGDSFVAGFARASDALACALASRDRMGTVRPPDPIWDAGAELTAIRERLGEEAFEQAWTEGHALTLEDALAFALRGRGPRERPQAGWDAITPTEMKVVVLVAEGLSNPQIAERLFISPRTVSTHLSHVFTKLGVTSRAELATAATKRGVS